MGKHSRLLVGTVAGLFEAQSSGVTWEAQPTSLMGKGAVRGLVVDPTDPEMLHAATSKAGFQRSGDGGRTWCELNDGIIYKDGFSLVQHPTTGALYFGSQPASVFKSTDRGETWSECEQLKAMPETNFWTFPHPPHMAHMKDLKVARKDPNRVYGAIEEGWLVRSLDGGSTWETLKQGMEFDAHYVTLLADQPETIVATSGTGIYRSENGGDTFQRSDDGIGPHGYMSAALSSDTRPDTFFAAAAELPPPYWRARPEGANTRFFRSDDRGKTWRKLSGVAGLLTGGPRAAGMDLENPDRVLFGLSDGSVWLTEDGGEHFERILEGLPAALVLRPLAD